jgi:peptide/nickel transport system permease protein
MTRYVFGRLLGVLETLVLASILSFIVLRVVPGDPARLVAGPLATKAALQGIREQMGLNQNIVVQYFNYIGGFVSGHWGFSYSAGQNVTTVLATRFPATLELALYAFVMAVVGALLFAVLASYKVTVFTGISKAISLIGLGTPPFWLALVLLLFFSSTLGVLPGPSGRLSSFLTPPTHITGLYTVDSLLTGNITDFSDALAHIILPAFTLSFLPWAFLTRLLTANLGEKTDAPFTTVVRSKGVSRWTTHRRHVLHNALLPTIGSSGLVFASLITGSVLVEQTFAWPGVGQVLVTAIQRQDFAIVQIFVLLSAVIYIVANLIVDFVSGIADPRLRVNGSTR